MSHLMSATESLQHRYDDYVYQMQFIAASGILGGRIYEKVVDGYTVLWLALSIISVAAVAFTAANVHMAVPIAIGMGALGMIAYTVYRIYQRATYQSRAKQLESVFKLVLERKFQDAYQELVSKLDTMISLTDLRQRFNRLEKFGEDLPFFCPRTGSSARYEKLTRLYYFLIVLTACEESCSDPDSVHDISYFNGYIRCGSSREEQFLSEIKKNPQELLLYEATEEYDVGEFLWTDLTQTFQEELKTVVENGRSGCWFNPQFAIDYVSYLACHFPIERFNVYKTCRSFEEFYNTALSFQSEDSSN
jgi:hypothetical protein